MFWGGGGGQWDKYHLICFLEAKFWKFTLPQFFRRTLPNGAGRDSFMLHLFLLWTTSEWTEAPEMPIANLRTAVCISFQCKRNCIEIPALCVSFHALPFCLEPITLKYSRNGMLGLTTLNALSGDLDFWCIIRDIIALEGAAFPLSYCGSTD